MKEYGIYIRKGSAMPYMVNSYKNFYDAQASLLIMVDYEDSRGRPFYVDNDFYKNTYKLLPNFSYFCIKEREVTEWVKADDFSSKKDNIVFFSELKKKNL